MSSIGIGQESETTMSKHTPGPWTVRTSMDQTNEAESWLQPLDVYLPDRLSDEDVALIVAAPDLLEACKWAFHFNTGLGGLVNESERRRLQDKLDAAIAKAEGTSPLPRETKP